MGKLEGKVAIVTGAGRGIGKAIALAFAREGADVVIPELQPELAEETAKEVTALGRQALAVKTDVRLSGEVEARAHGLPWLIEEEHWDATFDVNVKGNYLCC